MFFTAANDLMMGCPDIPIGGISSNINNNNNNNVTWIWMTIVPVGFYSALSVLNNVMDCYNFFLAWNLISRTHRMDVELLRSVSSPSQTTLEEVKQQRRKDIRKVLVTKNYQEVLYPKEATCPICLGEFEPNDAVSSVSDPNKNRGSSSPSCNHMFHEGCLTLWLQQHSNCPCCRHEILPLPRQPRSPLPIPVFPTTDYLMEMETTPQQISPTTL